MSDPVEITREQVLDAFPLTAHLQRKGVKLVGQGNDRTTNVCGLKAHKDGHMCVNVNVQKQIWHCHDCSKGGSIVDWLAAERNQHPTDVYRELRESVAGGSVKKFDPAKAQVVATYDYTDEKSELLYQVLRYEPKTFRQRRPVANGGWDWSMDGVTRVLYRLPEVLRSKVVIVCEGEKDADNVSKLGFCGTSSVSGAGKWLASYADILKGKDVVVIPDNDEPGRKHGESIVKSLLELANSVKVVPMPEPHKDASDFITSIPDPEKAKVELQALISRAPHALKPLPLFTIQEMEQAYIELVRNVAATSFDLGRFLPSFGIACRKLIPGDLAVIMAGTGVGKTAIMQQVARAAKPLPTVFFELELPCETLFERFVQMEIQAQAHEVEEEYRQYTTPIWQHYRGLYHILVCPESGISMDQIESLINRSELKSGVRPVVVLVDYIGLVRAVGVRSRYEAVSYVAEQMKVIAKRTNTIVIMATQISRRNGDEDLEVGLHDGKDSGSIENSAGLVIGAWRPEHETIVLKILKNTKGRTGREIVCNFDGSRMLITERAQIEPPSPTAD